MSEEFGEVAQPFRVLGEVPGREGAPEVVRGEVVLSQPTLPDVAVEPAPDGGLRDPAPPIVSEQRRGLVPRSVFGPLHGDEPLKAGLELRVHRHTPLLAALAAHQDLVVPAVVEAEVLARVSLAPAAAWRASFASRSAAARSRPASRSVRCVLFGVRRLKRSS